jgi:hypothetical protein
LQQKHQRYQLPFACYLFGRQVGERATPVAGELGNVLHQYRKHLIAVQAKSAIADAAISMRCAVPDPTGFPYTFTRVR